MVTAALADASSAPPGLNEGIAGLYDESSGLWENIWGEHMHHGFYDAGEAADMSDHRRAQIRMIEEALAFAAVPGEYTSGSYACSCISSPVSLSS
jgi:tocopherol O-methyltransferase